MHIAETASHLTVTFAVYPASHFGRLELPSLIRIVRLQRPDALTGRERAANRIDDPEATFVTAELEGGV